MSDYLGELFSDKIIVDKIKSKLPQFFQLAELDSSRAGKLGMEVGSARERIIIALLMYKFGEENIKTDIPITKPEIDVILFDNPISIKTATGKRPSGVKLIWTVDSGKALEFSKNYYPSMDMIFVQINWGDVGWLYFFPKESQIKVFEKMGKKKYIKLPKKGTNPRGVEITREALELLVADDRTLKIKVDWTRGTENYDVYDRWLELWKAE